MSNYYKWLKSDNVVKVSKNNYREHTTQWRKLFTKKELKQFYTNEFITI